MFHFLSFSTKQRNAKGVVRCKSKLLHRVGSLFFWGNKTIISFQKYNMRGFCCIDHKQGYGRVTLMVTGCFSSETAVSLLMETSDNGCPNRTTLSNISAITCLRLKCQHMKENWQWAEGLKLHFTSSNCLCNPQLIIILIFINSSKPAEISRLWACNYGEHFSFFALSVT